MDDLVRRILADGRADRPSAERALKGHRQRVLAMDLPPDDLGHILLALDEALRRQATPIVFREPRTYEFIIGHVGEERRVRSTLAGLSPARLAIANWRSGPETVRAVDFAAPGARRPDNAVRNALRTAADWIDAEVGCRPLAAALRVIKVEGGIVRYRPARGAPDILT